MYHYAGNNPIKYTDPDGRAAWEDKITWDSSMEDTFREYYVANVKKLVEDAKKNNKTIDCADVALTAFINTAADMGLYEKVLISGNLIGCHLREYNKFRLVINSKIVRYNFY